MNIPSDTLRYAAERAAGNQFFLAAALETYRQEHDLSEQGLAGYLGCSPDVLPSLALCRQPADASFQQDVARIAARFGVSASQLAALLREVEVLEAFRDDEIAAVAMAARDREDEEE